MISDEMSKKFKKALIIAVNVGCGFEADAEDAAELLTLIVGLESRIAELETMVKGHDPFEDFPSKERGFECSVVVLGKFEYEDEFNPITNWDLCVYWFDEERWHPLNGYVAGDDIVKWYSLPEECEE